ncbi:MAG: polysaccharide deacetylase family protein [Sporolactobacillus sp.]
MRLCAALAVFFCFCITPPSQTAAVADLQSRYHVNGRFPKPVHRFTAQSRRPSVCYLTFDDGPSNNAEALLDLLNRYQAKATFFLLAKQVAKHPQSVRRMKEEGFTIGLHGVSHNYKLLYRSKHSVVREMSADQKIVRETVQITTPFIRTPYGSYPFMNSRYRQATARHGFIMWDWNVDSRDWLYKDWRFVAETIRQIKRLHRNGEVPVILLHDRLQTYRYLAPLLNYLKQSHYEMRAFDASIPPLQFPERRRS